MSSTQQSLQSLLNLNLWFVGILCGMHGCLPPIIALLFHGSQIGLQHPLFYCFPIPFVTDIGTQCSILRHSLFGQK